MEFLVERRRYERYPVTFRVFLPDHGFWGVTRDISLEGCFVQTEQPVASGFVTDLWIELPIVGVLKLQGYIHHSGTQDRGMGLQFVQVRFEQDQSNYYKLYVQFIKLLPEMQRIREEYIELAKEGRLKLLDLPQNDNGQETPAS